MKKILVFLSLITFVAVSSSFAQTTQADSKATKKEVSAKSDAKPAGHACCKSGAMKSCTPEQMKSCTPAQKADCMKGEKAKASSEPSGAKAKAESETEKKDGTKANNN